MTPEHIKCRNERDALRAEVERLTDHRDHYLNQCGTLNRRIAELEARLRECVGYAADYGEDEAQAIADRAYAALNSSQESK